MVVADVQPCHADTVAHFQLNAGLFRRRIHAASIAGARAEMAVTLVVGRKLCSLLVYEGGLFAFR